MRDKHEPHDAFIDRLESQIASEVRQRNRQVDAPGWPMRSRLRLAVAAIGLALVSMGVGGAVVAAAYQAQNNVQRDLLAASYTLRLELAKSHLAKENDQLETAQRKVSAGMATNEELLEARLKVAISETAVKSMQLQLDEVQLTGREPVYAMSAPLVSGRDFVGERLSAMMGAATASLDVNTARMQSAQARVNVGLADSLEVGVAQAELSESQAAIETLRRKLEIRQKFVRGEMDAVQTELRVLEAEVEGRLKALKPRTDLAHFQMDQTANRVRVGAAQSIELAEAKLRLQQLQVDLAKAELDLAVVRKRLSGKDDR